MDKKNFVSTPGEMPCFRGNYLGMTQQAFHQRAQKERDALLCCGVFLGDCYIMCEAVEWLLKKEEYEKRIKAAPWFKREIKHNINLAINKLHKSIYQSKATSKSDSGYMMDIADSMYERVLAPEIMKLRNSFLLTLKPGVFDKQVPDMAPVADLLVIMVLLQWVGMHYDSAVAYMKTKFPDADYDGHYNGARCTDIEMLCRDSMKMLIERHGLIEVDFAQDPMVNAAVKLIDNKMASTEASNLAMEEIDQDELTRNVGFINQSLQAMGIQNTVNQ